MKTTGAIFKCDRCGVENFISDASMQKQGGLTSMGVYKVTVPRKSDLHLCEDCFMKMIAFLNQQEIDPDISIGGEKIDL